VGSCAAGTLLRGALTASTLVACSIGPLDELGKQCTATCPSGLPCVGGICVAPSSVAADASTRMAPPAAAEAGYTMPTFASTTIGAAPGTWQSFGFYGNREPSDAFLQNADGSLSLTGNSGNHYGADLCTAAPDASQPDGWRGIAFGGGFYVEAALSFTGTPSGDASGWPTVWASDIDQMSLNAVSPLTQWPGQPATYGDWVVIDVMAADVASASAYGPGIHNYYGANGSAAQVAGSLKPAPIGSASFSSVNRYGALWVPATSTTQGSISFFFNDTLVGSQHWDEYDPQLSPPPVLGTSAFSVLDTRRMALLLGESNPGLPMTVTSVTVWQTSSANALTQQ
jgi:hypothetical protein